MFGGGGRSVMAWRVGNLDVVIQVDGSYGRSLVSLYLMVIFIFKF